jgi:hypothetical protein
MSAVAMKSSSQLNAWQSFLDALAVDDDRGPNKGRPRPFNAVTHAGGLGCFGIPVQRLVDLGVLDKVYFSNGKAIANLADKRVIAFLKNPLAQRDALNKSMKQYAAQVDKLTLPAGMSRSGALALFHRLGPQALDKWAKNQQPSTAALFRRANGLF